MKIDARNVRRYWIARCSTTRVMTGHRRYSISERPVSRRNTSSSVDRRTRTVSGRSPRSWAADRGRLAVVGVEQDPVGEPLDPLGEAVELAVERLLDAGREAQLGDLARRVALDQLARRALGDDLRLVHDDEPVAELLGLVHVVGRQDERHAALLEPVEAVPEQVAGLRVEAGRRLVEQQQVRLVDQRPGDRQAPLHAARQRLDLRRSRARSAGRTRAARRRAGAHSARGRPK